MDKEPYLILLLLFASGSIFLAVQPMLQPTFTPGANLKFSDLGVLGPGGSFSGYPKNVTVGHPVFLYGYIENQQGSVQFYQVLVKLGSTDTPVSNSSPSAAPVVRSYTHVLDNNQSWTFPIYLTLNKTATNDRIVFELWYYDALKSSFLYTGVWSQIWVNVTSP